MPRWVRKSGSLLKWVSRFADKTVLVCTIALRARVRANDTRREDKTVRTFRFVMFVTLWLAAATSAAAQAVRLTSKEAKNHVGEKATVCGKVAGIHFVSSGKGQPTFIHFDEPYPDQIFTLVIWGSDRPRFGRPEEIYRDKELCVTGKITIYLGIPEIVATAPNQVQVQK